jgi:hypothetical protein
MVDAAAAAVANGIDPVISPNVYSPLPCILWHSCTLWYGLIVTAMYSPVIYAFPESIHVANFARFNGSWE